MDPLKFGAFFGGVVIADRNDVSEAAEIIQRKEDGIPRIVIPALCLVCIVLGPIICISASLITEVSAIRQSARAFCYGRISRGFAILGAAQILVLHGVIAYVLLVIGLIAASLVYFLPDGRFLASQVMTPFWHFCRGDFVDIITFGLFDREVSSRGLKAVFEIKDAASVISRGMPAQLPGI
ncbi:MAG: hypothetical protein A3F09_02480 [Chlamydiae bacterium RIFCSPHIGHO2_12_FULL_49_11]|nr:MAG: hypothetical protein A3F09_02480 [Chlamydiae bacterium RIFCSPHIGHO2_12_FULL_49_11]